MRLTACVPQLPFFRKNPSISFLMDIQMPEMDGFAAAAAIRQIEENTGSHTPVVAMSARALKGDQEKCLASGRDG